MDFVGRRDRRAGSWNGICKGVGHTERRMNLRIKKTTRLALGLLADRPRWVGPARRADTIIVSLVQVTGSDPDTVHLPRLDLGIEPPGEPRRLFPDLRFRRLPGWRFLLVGRLCDNCAILPGEMVTVDAPGRAEPVVHVHRLEPRIPPGATIFNPGNSTSLGMFGATSSYSGMQGGSYTLQDFITLNQPSWHGWGSVPAPEPVSCS